MRGIYKITSPSGKIYIGQSTNIRVRFYNYRKCDSCKKQRILYSSFLKYGIGAHVFEVVYELPKDCDASVLTNYEQFFMDQFREAGYSMMNLKEAGLHGGHSEETKRKLSVAHMGRPKAKEAVAKQAASMKGRPSAMKGKKHSPETIALIREKRANQINLPRPPKGSVPWNKGLKTGHKPWNKGMSGEYEHVIRNPMSQESRKKIADKLRGRKLNAESIRKREATRKANGNNKGWSEEARKRRSELYKGRPSNRKGCKMPPEAIEKMRQTKIGKKPSLETRLKMSAAQQKRFHGKEVLNEPS